MEVTTVLKYEFMYEPCVSFQKNKITVGSSATVGLSFIHGILYFLLRKNMTNVRAKENKKK